jgi:hypothetical protein
VEVKFRYDREIEAMLHLYMGPHAGHVNQVKCQIGLAHEAEPMIVRRCYNSGRLAINWTTFDQREEKEVTEEICPQHMGTSCLHEEQLLGIDRGFIYYASRDDATRNREFYFEHDPRFMERGLEKLRLWRQFFEQGILPQTNFEDKRYAHPFSWKWTYDPCRYCDFGEECRVDTKAAIKAGEPIKLEDSDAIDVAKRVRPDYSFEATRNKVLARWGLEPKAPETAA